MSKTSCRSLILEGLILKVKANVILPQICDREKESNNPLSRTSPLRKEFSYSAWLNTSNYAPFQLYIECSYIHVLIQMASSYHS